MPPSAPVARPPRRTAVGGSTRYPGTRRAWSAPGSSALGTASPSTRSRASSSRTRAPPRSSRGSSRAARAPGERTLSAQRPPSFSTETSMTACTMGSRPRTCSIPSRLRPTRTRRFSTASSATIPLGKYPACAAYCAEPLQSHHRLFERVVQGHAQDGLHTTKRRLFQLE